MVAQREFKLATIEEPQQRVVSFRVVPAKGPSEEGARLAALIEHLS